MNKKHFKVIALAVVLVLSLTTLVACNNYKWDSIGGGNPDKASVSNGGYVVEQGEYIYFINGFVGDVTDNEWGKAVKQSIVRAKRDAEGNVINSTVKIVVPKVISNKSVNGGFAIFGNWIYYATPNTEEDKAGKPSTTHTDFMRTSLDAKTTQRIGTINSREAEYFFTPSRVFYFLNKTISYIDFSGMKGNKPINDGKGAVGGTLAENVENVLWKYDSSYLAGQGAEVTDYIFYTQTLTGDNSFEAYNNTYAVKYDGSGLKTLITKDTFLTQAEKDDIKASPSNVYKYQNKIATVQLNDIFVEADGNATLYYSKKHKINEEAFDTACLYMAKFNFATGELDITTEKQLTVLATTFIYPLGYAVGAIAVTGGDFTLYDGNAAHGKAPAVLASGNTIQTVIAGTVYFTASGATELSAIKLPEWNETDSKWVSPENAKKVIGEPIKADWLKLEFIGTKFYFVNTKYSYVQFIDMATFNPDDKDAK
ncbi:MAG: hypothetical protein RSB59_02675, partial [Clostridia bacterium]